MNFLRSLIDPNSAPLRGLSHDLRDLAIAADNSHVLAFDNISYVPPAASDALCGMATGRAFVIRSLYTNRDEERFEAIRPVMLGGIEELATRPDLIDRAMILEMPQMEEAKRRSEADLQRDFENARPRILGALLDGVACALREVDSVQLSRQPRMLDFARWAAAAMPAFGWTAKDFLNAYMANRAEARALSVEASAIGPLIVDIAGWPAETNATFSRPAGWSGTAATLLAELNSTADDATKWRRDFPKTPIALANALRRIAPALRDAGVLLDFSRNHQGRAIRLGMTDSAHAEKKKRTKKEPPKF
jgi:hypothetical protein